MPLVDFFPDIKQFRLMQGIEKELLRRKRNSKLTFMLALVVGTIQMILIISTDRLKIIGNLLLNLFQGDWEALATSVGLAIPELLGFLLLGFVFGTYLLLKWTRFLIGESSEPFRYTFWIAPFASASASPLPGAETVENQFANFLHHDLSSLIHQRIGRLFLLDEQVLPEETLKTLPSHIHIQGNFALRKNRRAQWTVQITPRIRIGGIQKPDILTRPVNFVIPENEIQNGDGLEIGFSNSAIYFQILERLYSMIATEIYRQIETDVQEKIKMFPSRYLQAVALYYEAEDFAGSNTIDAYDRAIHLYQESLKYFRRPLYRIWNAFFLKLPLLWRMRVKSIHMQSQIQMGYTRCLIYRREISPLSGRFRNPLFSAWSELQDVLKNLQIVHNRLHPRYRLKNDKIKTTSISPGNGLNRLQLLMTYLTHPGDSLPGKVFRPINQLREENQSLLFFEAHVLTALALFHLGAISRAKAFVKDAEAIAPSLCDNHPLYLLTAGRVEAQLDREVAHFRKAIEVKPDFEIAHYLLAHFEQMRLRLQNEFSVHRVQSILDIYDRVVRINPGNVAAYSAMGYLNWLVGMSEEAGRKFYEGIEIKSASQETFVGELYYGLARKLAEDGDYNQALEYFQNAVMADPGIAAYSSTASRLPTTLYFDYVDSTMLKRFEHYCRKIERDMDRRIRRVEDGSNGKLKNFRFLTAFQGKEIALKSGETISLGSLNRLRSFVLNDFGNVCLNYYHRIGDEKVLDRAIRAFQKALKYNRENRVVYYNLQNACSFSKEKFDIPSIVEYARQAAEMSPTWPVAVTASIHEELRLLQDKINKVRNRIAELNEKRAELEENLRQQPSMPSVASNVMLLSGVSNEQHLTQKVMKSNLNKKGMGNVASQQKFASLENQWNEINQKINHCHEELQKTIDEQLETAQQMVKKLIMTTRLSPLFEGFHFDANGHGVNELLSRPINKNRLDEYDVDILGTWLEILSYNYQSVSAIQSAWQLSDYIQEHFWPDDFDTNMVVHGMIEALKLNPEGREILKEVDGFLIKQGKGLTVESLYQGARGVIRSIIEDWLEQDPIHFLSLYWMRTFMNKDEQVFYLKRALDHAPNSASYLASLAEDFMDLQEYELAIEAYQAILSLEPQEPKWYQQMGDFYLEQKKGKEAYACFDQAIQLEPTRAEHYAGKAEACLLSNKRDEALKMYQKAISLDELNWNYYNEVGNLHYYEGQIREAIKYYQKAISLNSKDAVLYSNLSWALLEERRWEEAIEALQQSVTLQPQNAAYLNRLGNLYLENGQPEQAVDYYTRAIQISQQDAVFYQNRALAYQALEDWENAQQDIAAAIQLDPHQAEFYNTAGNLKFSQGQYQAALGEYQKAIEIQPDWVVLYANAGLAERFLGDWKAAEHYYQMALEREPNNPALLNGLGNIFYDRGQFEEAKQYFLQAARLDKQEAIYASNVALSCLNTMDYQAALRWYRKAWKLSPEDAGVLNGIGTVYFRMGNFKQAKNYYRQAIALQGDSPLYFANLGLAELQLQHWEEAVRAFQESLRLDGSIADNWFFYATALKNLPDTEAAEKAFREALRLSPNEIEYLEEWGVFLIEQNRLVEAEKVWRQLVELDPGQAGYWNYLGLVNYRQQKYQDAIDCYRNAINFQENNAIFHQNLGLAFQDSDRTKEAIRSFERAAELDSRDEFTLDRLITLYLGQKDIRRAEHFFKKLLQLKPENAKLVVDWAMVCWQMNHPDLTIQYLQKALQQQPGNAEYWNLLGNAYLAIHEYDKAEDAYHKALELDAEQALYYANLSQLLERKNKLDEAIDVIRKAIKLQPDESEFYNLLGMFYFRTKLMFAAAEAFLEAFRLKPDESIYQENLLQAFQKLPEQEQAILKEKFQEKIPDKQQIFS